jgi:hypothetical protein
MAAPINIKKGSRGKGRGIQSRALNPNLIQYKETNLTSAQVLTLNATPVEVVPAPGAGYVTEFISAVCILDYGTATYASNGVSNFRYTDGSGTVVSDSMAAAAFLHQADDCIEVCQALSAETELTANAAIMFSVDTGEVDTGDSPVRIKVAYRIHETGL